MGQNERFLTSPFSQRKDLPVANPTFFVTLKRQRPDGKLDFDKGLGGHAFSPASEVNLLTSAGW